MQGIFGNNIEGLIELDNKYRDGRNHILRINNIKIS